MAFAKLSGSLLASNDAPSVRALAQARSAPRPVPAAGATSEPPGDGGFGQDAANPVDVAQLHDALRECIEANDQEGVSQVFAHLVRAGQPISAIADMVEALSKPPPTDDVEASGPVLADSSEPDPPRLFEQSSAEPVDPEVAAESFDEDAISATVESEENDAAAREWSSVAADVDLGSGTLPLADQHLGWAVEPHLLPQAQESSDIIGCSEAVDDGILSEQGAEPAAVAEPRWGFPDTSSRTGDEPPARASVREIMQHAAIAAEPFASPPRSVFLSPKARLGAALAAAAALVGTSVFLLLPPATQNPVSAAAKPAAVGATTAPGDSRPALTGTTAEKPSPAAAPPTSAPDISTAATASAIADARPADVAPVKPPVASERSEKVSPTVTATSEGTVAAASAAAADPPETKVPANVAPPTDPAGAAPPSIAPAVAPAATDRPETKTALASLEPAKEAAAVAAPAAISPPPAPSAAAKREAEPAKEPALSSGETAFLLERGDRLFGVGDIASARLFYERAADAGDAQAALRLGGTYDPAFLQRAQLRLPGDPKLAVFWYRRAQELGAGEAQLLLSGMQTR
jgi:hypothetical protein